MDADWNFRDTDKDTRGLNDPLLGYFKASNSLRHIVRESIQNSLDAHDLNSKPATVKFQLHQEPLEVMPGLQDLKEAMSGLEIFQDNNSKNKQLAEYKLLEAGRDNLKYRSATSRLRILEISDFNTIGLKGSEYEVKGNLHKLIYADGSNDPSGVAGGAYGIGKGAPFLNSRIRTVFYSTLYFDQEESVKKQAFVGKARLPTFRKANNSKKKWGIGYYGHCQQPALDPGVIKDDRFIPEFFKRQAAGTSIFVMDYIMNLGDNEWEEELIYTVLYNFWPAIYYEKLIFQLVTDTGRQIEINKQNLEEEIEKHGGKSKEILGFYKTLVSPNKHFSFKLSPQAVELKRILNYTEDFEDVDFYVNLSSQKQPEFLNKIIRFRSPLMVINPKGVSSKILNKPFNGVFVCRNPILNSELREMEPVTHDKWVPMANDKTTKERQKAILKVIKNFIDASLDSLREKVNQTNIVAELSQYLPTFNPESVKSQQLPSKTPVKGLINEPKKGVKKSIQPVKQVVRFGISNLVDINGLKYRQLKLINLDYPRLLSGSIGVHLSGDDRQRYPVKIEAVLNNEKMPDSNLRVSTCQFGGNVIVISEFKSEQLVLYFKTEAKREKAVLNFDWRQKA